MEQNNIRVDLYRGQLLPWHKEVLKVWDRYPYKVLAIGRKGRKTTFDINELFYHAMTDPRGLTYPFIAPTKVQAKEIVWGDHVEKLLRLLKQYNIPFQVNRSELSIRFPGHGTVVIDGSENIESLRGKSDWGGVVMDEIASWKNKRYAWEEVIEPNLSVHNAWAIFSGTPRGYDYFHQLMKRGDHAGHIEGDAFDEYGHRVLPHKDYISFRFTSYDNPYLDKNWIESKKSTLDTTSFNQEYLARFESYSGRIYSEFDRRVHVVDQFDIPQTWQIYRCMDFGSKNPTVCLWIGVDHANNWWVFDEYYMSNRTTEFHAGVIKEKHSQLTVAATVGDPSGEQAILDYAGHGVYIIPGLKVFNGHQNWVRSGIDKIKQMLKLDQTGKPKLYVFSNCTNTIREFESYRWMGQKATGDFQDIPLKENDHCLDALRYLVVTNDVPVENQFEEPFLLPQYNKITGY